MKQFDKYAESYNVVRGKITYPEQLYKRLAKLCGKTRRALDIGCGNGASTIRLKEYFDIVEGVDLGENLIKHASQNYPDIEFTVSRAEEFDTSHQYNLITSATSFYWMDRNVVAKKCLKALADNGVFCAYKYDWPIVYGSLRNLIESELSNKWCHYRDERIVNYDDTTEVLAENNFKSVEREVFSNIVELSPEEVALFFLSTSYVTKYIDEVGGDSYKEEFLQKVKLTATEQKIKVNFDIHAYIAMRQ